MQTVKKLTTEQPELAERFNRTLGAVVEAMDASGLRYAFIGGIASGGQGRPRATQDIDIFVRPEDAELALRALERHGFRTERTDPSWLYKAWKENILVDVIFKSKGEFYLDRDLYDRTVMAEFHGHQLRMVGPEDLTIIKASAHSELTPGHWHDALALLMHANLDWDYFIRRARRAPRRVLSLLIYAHSSDVFVPKQVIDELYRYVYGEIPLPAPPRASATSIPVPAAPAGDTGGGRPGSHTHAPPGASSPLRMIRGHPDTYVIGRLKERLAEDPRLNELDIEIDCHGDRLLLRGEVMTEERRQTVESVAREVFPGLGVENQIRVTRISPLTDAEEMR
jgi:predicted nucleotidyltransferase